MVISFLTYLILFFVPLVVIPGIDLRFEPPKVLITELLIAVLVVYVIATGKFSLKRVNKVFAGVLACLFLLSAFHLIASPTEQNLFGNVFRLQGTVLFWHLLVFAIIAQNLYFRLSDKYIYTAGLIGVLIGSVIFGSNSAGRWIGSLGEPNALGAVIVFIFPFVFLNFKSVWVRVVGVIGAFGVINFAESRSALIALCLELLFILLIKVFKGRYVFASLICFSLLLGSLILPILERQYFLMTNTNPLNFRFEDRAEIWEVALSTGFKSPVFGSGIESVQEKIKTTAKEMNVNAQYQVIDSSHNILLDYWIWGGGIGLVLLGVLAGFGIKNMIEKKMVLELAVFVGLLVVLSFNPTTVSVLAGFWWVIGRSFVEEPQARNYAEPFDYAQGKEEH